MSEPGTYQIRRPIKVTEVLAMGGGITPSGSQQVTLVSKGANGGSRRKTVNVADVLQRGDLAQDALVGNGDIVYVPPAPKFYIYGEVRNPGAYPLQDGMTVQQAISVGGGLIVRGTQRGIQLAQLDTGVPMAFCVLTCDTLEQAIDRAGLKSGNKGFDAGLGAIEMARLSRKLKKNPPRPRRRAPRR